jgi:hypothetical protein
MPTTTPSSLSLCRGIEGSRLHHWLPWPCWVPISSVGRGSGPLPCAFCSFAHHSNTKGCLAHHSNAVFITTFFASFLERRLDEVRRTTLLPRTPVNRPSSPRSGLA